MYTYIINYNLYTNNYRQQMKEKLYKNSFFIKFNFKIV